MGRTVAPISYTFIRAKESCSAFRKALRRSDQLALDELFVYANLHLAPAAYAAHPLPFQIFLLAMILEEHKEVMRIRELMKDNNRSYAVLKEIGGVWAGVARPNTPISSQLRKS